MSPSDGGAEPAPEAAKIPIVAVVGRPNVGKSTLVNRLIGRREAVVEDVPGVTRDRVAYDATWRGRPFTVVDTGGWEPDAHGLAARVAAQAGIAVTAADAVLLVVDATVGATDADEAVARVLQRSGKPVVLAANKVDDARGEADAAALWALGLGEPIAVSALHGRSSGDLLDAIYAALPHVADVAERPTGPRRVAIVGRPNVGKSSLLNRLAGEERAIVDPRAGTTRDPVDAVIELGSETWRVVDTAGLRRRVKEASGSEYYSSLRTAAAIEAAEVAIIVLDASAPLSEQDQRIVGMAADAGRAIVLLLNKWDLLDEDRRLQLEREIERDLARVAWAPRVNVSARTGRGIEQLAPAMRTALGGWEQRIPTGRLNAWLADVIGGTPPPVRGGRAPRVLFATQAAIRPPRVVLFTTGFLEAGYRRFLERRLRESFGFSGTPIDIGVRVKDKRTGGALG
ncbi:MAG TPA: ribosome biogenesis GTPase Der [Mycobacteriales bacterium]|nr:ribosome biogenesis GTPase Der [Mycobacteriales bacterium]